MMLILGLCTSMTARAEPQKLAAGEGLQGRFEQVRHLTGFEQPIRSTGVFYLLPGIELIWQTETPFRTRTILDDFGVRQDVKGRQVTQIELSRFPGLKVLRDALEDSLSGNWQQLEALSGHKLQKNGDKWLLQMAPQPGGPSLPFQQVNFQIGRYLETVEIVKEGGDKDVITFFDQKQAPIAQIRQSADDNGGPAQ